MSWQQPLEDLYQRWIQNPITYHKLDMERFFRFEKACLKHSEISPSSEEFKERLLEDLNLNPDSSEALYGAAGHAIILHTWLPEFMSVMNE